MNFLKRIKINKRQVILLAVLVVFGYLMMDLNARLSKLYALQAERDELGQVVTSYSQTDQAVGTVLAYSTSEAAVLGWARAYGHMHRPGDQVIIPVSPKDFTPSPPVVATPAATQVENWQLWRMLFFSH